MILFFLFYASLYSQLIILIQNLLCNHPENIFMNEFFTTKTKPSLSQALFSSDK